MAKDYVCGFLLLLLGFRERESLVVASPCSTGPDSRVRRHGVTSASCRDRRRRRERESLISKGVCYGARLVGAAGDLEINLACQTY